MPEFDLQNEYVFFGMVIGVLAVVLFLMFALFGFLGRGNERDRTKQSPLAINVASLELDEIIASQQLLLYGIPMRLVVLVIAPSGHAVKFPSNQQLPENIERLVPGLPNLLDSYQPEFRQWPAQMSVEGFKRSFFQHIPLPGDDGKGTTWCGVVGPFESKGGRLLAGLILRSEEPNGYGQIEIEHEGQWHQAIQVKNIQQ